MNRNLMDLDELETCEFQVSVRRGRPCNKPPRRESPRFARQRTSGNEAAGMHRRGNKRCGL